MYSLLIYNFYYDFLELILKKLSLFDMIKNNRFYFFLYRVNIVKIYKKIKMLNQLFYP